MIILSYVDSTILTAYLTILKDMQLKPYFIDIFGYYD